MINLQAQSSGDCRSGNRRGFLLQVGALGGLGLTLEQLLRSRQAMADAQAEGLEVRDVISPDEIAKLLADGNVLGRCAGRMEFGLRALGNRSILADPRRWDTVAKINEAIKFRDFWMPFTPSMLESRAADYLVNPKAIPAPFMTHAFDSTALARKDLPAAMHPADKTLRPQVLNEKDNPGYHEIISAFEQQTGVGALLNTSFNLHGEPIVADAQDAYSTLIRSDLDGILVGNTALLKTKSP